MRISWKLPAWRLPAWRWPTVRLSPRWRRYGRRATRASLITLALGLAIWVGVRVWVDMMTQPAIFADAARAPTAPVALVFGAGVYPDGRLSSAAANRVDAAANLYRLGKVQKLLISGDNSTMWYDEVTPMKQRAVAQGVPDADVLPDYAGLRTYDSCYRARDVFGFDRMILVTQDYHLPRAVYTCANLGVVAYGLVAAPWPGLSWYNANVREEPARLLAWFEVHFLRPPPKVAGPREAI